MKASKEINKMTKYWAMAVFGLLLLNIVLSLMGMSFSIMAWLIPVIVALGGIITIYGKNKFSFGKQIMPILGLAGVSAIFWYVSSGIESIFAQNGLQWLGQGISPFFWGLTGLFLVTTILGAIRWVENQ